MLPIFCFKEHQLNATDKSLHKNLAQFDGETAQIDPDTIKPFAKSRKIYVQGSRADIQVPFREISLSDTPSMFGADTNAPVVVYDTSGAYTDLVRLVARYRCALQSSQSALCLSRYEYQS